MKQKYLRKKYQLGSKAGFKVNETENLTCKSHKIQCCFIRPGVFNFSSQCQTQSEQGKIYQVENKENSVVLKNNFEYES